MALGLGPCEEETQGNILCCLSEMKDIVGQALYSEEGLSGKEGDLSQQIGECYNKGLKMLSECVEREGMEFNAEEEPAWEEERSRSEDDDEEEGSGSDDDEEEEGSGSDDDEDDEEDDYSEDEEVNDIDNEDLDKLIAMNNSL